MKKSIYICIIITFIFLVSGCGQEPGKNEESFPSWLKGTWANATAHFTIAEDGTFTCDLAETSLLGSAAQVMGKLDNNNDNLGPNDYILRNMQTTGNAADYPGNEALSPQLKGFQNILITLSPKENNTKFTFTSVNMAAKEFFGGAGDYVKQP